MKHYTRFVTVCLLFVTIHVHAQQNIYKFKQITDEHGLPGVTVRSLFQDSKSLLWLGVESTGLCKYDGYNFTLYESKLNDSLSLCNNVVEAIAEDTRGNLWIGTQNGLSILNPQTQQFHSIFKNTPAPLSLPGNVVNDIILSKNKSIFIATDGGIAIATGNYRAITKINIQEKPFSCYDLFESSDGFVWAGTNIGLFKFSQTGEIVEKWESEAKNPLFQGNINAIAEDQDQAIWVGCNLQLIKISKQNRNGKIVKYLPANQTNTGSFICKIQASKQGTLWIGTVSEGLSILDPKTEQFDHITPSFTQPNGLKSLLIRDILEDKAGNIWLAQKFAGIQIFDSRQQLLQYVDIDIKSTDICANKSIISMFADADANIWLGTGKNGLQMYDQKNNRSIAVCKPTSLLSNTRINDIAEHSPTKTLWIATALGVFSYSRNSKKEQSWPIGSVIAVLVDKSNTVWAGTTKGLYYKNSSANTFSLYENGNKQYNNALNVKVLFEDSNEQLWVGTLQNGLYTIDKQQKTINFFENSKSNPNSISGDLIRYVFEDHKGQIWISTRGQGLNVYNKQSNKFLHYYEKDGLPSNTLFGILEDKQGNIWLSSYKGIAKFDPVAKTTDKFTKEFGLQNDVFEPQACCMSSSGDIFFGGDNGFNYFNPAKIKKQRIDIPLIITSIKIENTLFASDVSNDFYMELPWNKNYISFDFTLLDYISRQGIQYEYQLEGIDKSPIRTESRHSATYTNLDPGSYRFHIKGFTKDGTPNSNIITCSITIIPPFWKRIWFRITISLLLMTSVYMIFKFRIRTIKKRNIHLETMVLERTLFLEQQKQELILQKEKYQQQSEQLALANKKLELSNHTKDTLFSVISHDLKNPFNIIMRFSENVLTKYYTIDDQKKFQYISNIQTASKAVYALLENLLNWYRIQTGHLKTNNSIIDLHELVNDVVNEYTLTALEKQIIIHCNITPKLPINTDKDMLSTVIRNFLNNALKFTPEKGTVTISNTIFNGRIEISVTDTGVGMSESELESLLLFLPKTDKPMKKGAGTGLGLQICKELIDLMQGVLEVKSIEETGSTFSISLPFQNENNDLQLSIDDNNLLFSDLQQVDAIIEADKKSLVNKKVLLVDDNPAITEYLSNLLSSIYKISTASDGVQAYTIAQKELPDIIVSDLMMPEMNGFDLAQKLKSNKNTQHIPIILLTAQNAEPMVVAAYNIGISDFISKPFNDRIIRLKIHNVLLLKESAKMRNNIDNTVAAIPNAVTVDDLFMSKLFDTIRQNIENSSFDVEILAAEMGMSKSTLLRKLHQFTDKSPWELILEIRFEKAKELLKTGKYNVSEVAWAIGFSDVKYFSRKFKELYNIVPKDYMKSEK